MIEKACCQGQEIAVRNVDFRLLIHAHKELFELELDADVQQMHSLQADTD
jgi:hypothetical protein